MKDSTRGRVASAKIEDRSSYILNHIHAMNRPRAVRLFLIERSYAPPGRGIFLSIPGSCRMITNRATEWQRSKTRWSFELSASRSFIRDSVSAEDRIRGWRERVAARASGSRCVGGSSSIAGVKYSSYTPPLPDYFWRRRRNSEALNWLSRLPLNETACKVDLPLLIPTAPLFLFHVA